MKNDHPHQISQWIHRSILAMVAPFVLSVCKRAPNTPEATTEACLKELAAGNVPGAAKFFAREKLQQKWFTIYYQDQKLQELFDGPIGNVFISGDEAVVTYAPKETLFNAFGKNDLVLLKKEQDDWKVDFEEAGVLKNAINGGGVNINLIILGECLTEATGKLGRTPKTVEEMIDNLADPGAKSSARSYSGMFDYSPDGRFIDGVHGVIFYTKKPYSNGMHLGATKDKLFLSGDGKVIIETKL